MESHKFRFISTIIGLEFIVAAIFILKIEHSSSQGGFLGYSYPRLFLVVFTLFLSIIIFIFSKQKIREIKFKITEAFGKRYLFLSYLSISLFIAGILIWLTPKSDIGYFGYYFEPLRPLFLVLCIMPFQITFSWIIKNRTIINKKNLLYPLYIFIFLILISTFIATTKFGISPDIYFWNVAGIPLTSYQFAFVFFVTFNISFLISFIIKSLQKFNNSIIDVTLFLILYSVTILIWFNTPMSKHYFSIEPTPPHNQPYPYSDSRDYDLGAISINNGWGINFEKYTDKPFYIGLLAIFHLLSPNNYSNIIFFQISLLAFIIPLLYVFGKLFHSRFFGIFIALTILIKQRNAILLSSVVASVNPKLLVTEIFTLLGLLCIALLIFIWMKGNKKKNWLAFLIGTILGIASLIRTNPIIFLPAIPIFMLVVMRKDKKAWIIQSFAFIAGFIFIISPWLVIGKEENRPSYFVRKFYYVYSQRYSKILPLSTTKVLRLNFPKSDLSIDTNNYSPLYNFNDFPGFVINHILHNFIGSFLILPDTFKLQDQNLNNLVKRSYWLDEETQNWKGELESNQSFFIIFNFVIVSFGLFWSWRRWKWGGLIPLMIFLVYTFSLGFGRNSGSRYIVPIDWIVYFYYILGFIYLINLFFNRIINKNEVASKITPELAITSISLNRKSFIFCIAFILFAFLIIPLSNSYTVKNSPMCELEISLNDYNQKYFENLSENIVLELGQILYPELKNNEINAYFLSCKEFRQIKFKVENQYFGHGDLVIIGSDPNKSPVDIEIIVPPISQKNINSEK